MYRIERNCKNTNYSFLNLYIFKFFIKLYGTKLYYFFLTGGLGEYSFSILSPVKKNGVRL